MSGLLPAAAISIERSLLAPGTGTGRALWTMIWIVSPAIATSVGAGTWPAAPALVANPHTGSTSGAVPGKFMVPVVAQSSQVRLAPTRVQGPAVSEEAGTAVPDATSERCRREAPVDGFTPGRAAPGGSGPGFVTVLFLCLDFDAGVGAGEGEGVLVRAGEAAVLTSADEEACPAVPIACVRGEPAARSRITSPLTSAILRSSVFLITCSPSHRHTRCRISSA